MSETLSLLLHGCRGRMGQVLASMIAAREDMIVSAGVDRPADSPDGRPASDTCSGVDDGFPFPVYSQMNLVSERPDVVIDFSHHDAVPALMSWCVATETPVVVCTTALSEEQRSAVIEAAQTIPVFQSANMSVGINLLAKMAAMALPALERDFNVEIIEKHHNQKKDSPSGTALMLADAINDACVQRKDYLFGRHGTVDHCAITELGIHAVRGGTIPGEHTILLAGPDEVIELTHTALSREIFARGALRAAAWLKDRAPGLYSMADLLS